MAKQLFVVRSGAGTVSREYDQGEPSKQFTDPVVLAERIPRQHSGWESVTYKGRRYQLHGGCHVYWFINLSNPIG